MSHVTDVKLRVKDLDALEEAAGRLGFELRRNQKTYAWYGRFMNDSNAFGTHDPKTFGKGLHALRSLDHRDGDYEIGVVKARDGDGFELLVDTWGPGQKLVAAAGGPQLHGLRREYAATVSTRRTNATLARKGYRVVREDLPGNRIKLKVRKR